MWVAVWLVSNTFTITMAVFDVGQYVVNAVEVRSVLIQRSMWTHAGCYEYRYGIYECREMVVLALESMLVSLCMKILSVLITVILYGRMIEIYLIPRAPIPFATLPTGNGASGNNYLRGLLASVFRFYDGMRRYLCGAGIYH